MKFLNTPNQMDARLCDELLQEIFNRLTPTSHTAVSLVSRRWRHILRSSTTSLRVAVPYPSKPADLASLSAFLRQHPFLSSLVAVGGDGAEADSSGDSLLLAVAGSCPSLRCLVFVGSPVSDFSLCTLAFSCVNLSSMDVQFSRAQSLNWITVFKSLKSLSISFPNSPEPGDSSRFRATAAGEGEMRNLEILSLTGILAGDSGVGFLWRSCRNVKKLRLTRCESLGDYSSFPGFLLSCGGFQELELKTCRTIVDYVLLTLAGNSLPVNSLLIHDGGGKETLLHFIRHNRDALRKLDLRLPLDLDDTHLHALSENRSKSLTSLRLESSCLPTGDGLKALTETTAEDLEELALVNCKAVEREIGLLTALGQNLRRLRKLDLSHNPNLQDKEICLMLSSCSFLIELKLCGCRELSDLTLNSAVRSCRNLERASIKLCCGFTSMGVEHLVVNCRRLKSLEVEEDKVSEMVKTRFPEVLLLPW